MFGIKYPQQARLASESKGPEESSESNSLLETGVVPLNSIGSVLSLLSSRLAAVLNHVVVPLLAREETLPLAKEAESNNSRAKGEGVLIRPLKGRY
jgi:hypothetical protein